MNIELQVISIGPASRLARPEVQDMIEVEISELGINKCAYNYTLPCLYGMTNAEYDHDSRGIKNKPRTCLQAESVFT